MVRIWQVHLQMTDSRNFAPDKNSVSTVNRIPELNQKAVPALEDFIRPFRRTRQFPRPLDCRPTGTDLFLLYLQLTRICNLISLLLAFLLLFC